MSINALVAVDRNWNIANRGEQFGYYMKDLEYFKRYTLNKRILFGTNTLKTFHNHAPLDHRTNILLTRHPERYSGIDHLTVISDPDEIIRTTKYTILVGGESIYKYYLERDAIDQIIVTKFDVECDMPTASIPNLDNCFDWYATNVGYGYDINRHTKEEVRFQRILYTRLPWGEIYDRS